jgi:hypothetical protein
MYAWSKQCNMTAIQRLVVAMVLMFAAMVMETLLFVIRMQKQEDSPDPKKIVMNKKYPVGRSSNEQKDKDI